MSTLPASASATIHGVSSGRYLGMVMAAVTDAKKSVRVLQYILDTRAQTDPSHSIGHLLRCLSLAGARGVDISVLLHDYEGKAVPGAGNNPGAFYLMRRGISVRLFLPRESEQRRILHAKTVVIDDRLAVIGTQNWSPGAFMANAETAVAIESEAVARQLAVFFDGMWARSREAT